MLLGNINNPCVNRWGINSFWSHYWYSDKRYNQFLQQDIMFTTLIKTYVYYGAEAPPRFLQDKMWYKRSNLLIENWLPYENRWYTKVEIDLGYTVAYILRRESPEIFETRWNILRFNKWVVFNVRWLQPNKTKKKKRNKALTSGFTVNAKKSKTDTSKMSRIISRFSSSLKYTNFKSTCNKEDYIF